MKGKSVSKPTGLHAKKWRDASQMRGRINVNVQAHAPKDKMLWKKPESEPTAETVDLITRRYK